MKKKLLGRQSRPFTLKSTLLAVGGAFLLSLGMGLLLMRVFVTVDPSPEEENMVAEANKEETIQLKVETFVVQAGAFRTEGEAEEWRTELGRKNIPSLLWKRGDYYYLFIGQAGTEEEAKEVAGSVSLETYVKSWTVEGGTKTTEPRQVKDFFSRLETGGLPEESEAEQLWGGTYELPELDGGKLDYLRWLQFVETRLFP